MPALLATNLPDLRTFRRGKVRDVYDLEDRLLIVATDRISAFDVILPNGVPDKGKILCQMAVYWFRFTHDTVENHLITAKLDQLPSRLLPYRDQLAGRSMLVKKTSPIEIECIVRGYLSGSGWREYVKSGGVAGIPLPPGLKESERLPEPVFTPSSKNTQGHDVNITYEEMENRIGTDLASTLREKSLKLYSRAARKALAKRIIVADTKFEFGLLNGTVVLIDEILTPDSSRFWPADGYEAGRPQLSFDKQYVRDYLSTLTWNRTPPGPSLPEEVIKNTRKKYLEAFEKITGARPEL